MALNEFLIPSGFTWDEKTLSSNYGKVTIEPLERGYGVTLGNSLRRVLLSSIMGDAVTSVKIDDVLHETAVIQGVAEDTLDIIMNLKSLVVCMVNPEPKTIYMDIEKEGIVTAADFQPNSEVEIINPDLHIATLSSGARLRMEITVERGRGYVPAEDNKKPNQAIGTIPIDSIFSPVRRVKYEIENTRVGQITDYEKLTMEIWTNGSVQPQAALINAANLLINHLTIFVEETQEKIKSEEEEIEKAVAGISPPYDKNMDRNVAELELSVRAYNCLKTANINTIRELIAMDEKSLLKFRNFGRKSLNEIKEVLAKMGYMLGSGKPNDKTDDIDEDIEEIDEKPRRKSRS